MNIRKYHPLNEIPRLLTEYIEAIFNEDDEEIYLLYDQLIDNIWRLPRAHIEKQTKEEWINHIIKILHKEKLK